MPDDNVASDLVIEESSGDELNYGWHLLLDLQAEFQGASLLFAVLTIVVPVLSFGAYAFDLVDREAIVQFAIASVLMIGCLSVSLFSWYYLRWTRRRITLVERRMRETGA